MTTIENAASTTFNQISIFPVFSQLYPHFPPIFPYGKETIRIFSQNLPCSKFIQLTYTWLRRIYFPEISKLLSDNQNLHQNDTRKSIFPILSFLCNFWAVFISLAGSKNFVFVRKKAYMNRKSPSVIF